MASDGNNFNDFPANQLNKFLSNTAELIPNYILVCHVTNQHYDCVQSLFNQHVDAFRILCSNEIQALDTLSYQQKTQIIPAWRHFYALRESWARRIIYINSWGISSKINRAVTIFNFDWWITDSSMQITIYEIWHFTLMTELLTFTIYFAFLCKPGER